MKMRKLPKDSPTGESPAARRRRKKNRPMSFAALESGDLLMIDMLLAEKPDLGHDRDPKGASLFMAAAFQGRDDVVAKLLPTAGPLDAFEAAALGRTERLVEILDAGEATPTDAGRDGYGLLHLSCLLGRAETAEMLLDRGVGIDVVAAHPLKVTPVLCAASGRHHDLVARLLDRGADVTARQAGDWTLLHHAAQQGHLAFAEDLLARGADPDAKNQHGHRPIDVAKALDHQDVVALLDPDA
jgi:uncharacterized protein